MRYLLVEDNYDLADAITKRLRQDGHATEHAGDLQTGRDYLATGDFDLVILDVNLPDGLGFELLTEMRRGAQPTPVIVLTARNEIDDKIDALDLGADDYVVKPFALEELVARIRAIQRRSQSDGQTMLTLGKLVYSQNLGEVLVDNIPLQLTKSELRLLEVFLNQPRRVFEKNHLIDRLYSLDNEVSPNALELIISRLRKKLAGSGVEIKTLRGLGYQVIEAAS